MLMTTQQLASDDYINQQLQAYNVTSVAIAELQQYMHIKIDGIEDKTGYKAVVSARKVVKNYRVQIEKKRKELNADALKFQRAINAEALRITDLLKPIETHLLTQEESYEAEKERLAKEREQEELSMQANRIQMLLEMDYKLVGTEFVSDYCTIKFRLEVLKKSNPAICDLLEQNFAVVIKHYNAYKEHLANVEHEREKAELAEAKLAKEQQDKIIREQLAHNERIREADKRIAKEKFELEKRAKELEEKDRTIKAHEEAQKEILNNMSMPPDCFTNPALSAAQVIHEKMSAGETILPFITIDPSHPKNPDIIIMDVGSNELKTIERLPTIEPEFSEVNEVVKKILKISFEVDLSDYEEWCNVNLTHSDIVKIKYYLENDNVTYHLRDFINDQIKG